MIKRLEEFARLFTVLLLSGLFVRALSLRSADDVIQAVQNRYNGAQTLSVNFIENYSIAGHARPPESGTLTLKKKGKMRWDYEQPRGKLFISDGKSVFLYTSRDNRVEKIPLKDTEDMRAPLAFLLGRLDLKKEFGGFQVRAGDSATWLDASAKMERLPYEKVEMLISPDGCIRRLNVLGRDQSITAFSFDNERLNPRVPDELFQFSVPSGATVVDSITNSQEK